MNLPFPTRPTLKTAPVGRLNGSATKMATELEKHLNLVWSSPTFAIKLRSDGSGEVFQPKMIPDDEFEYLVAATVTLRNGRAADAVFKIVGGGAAHTGIYFRVHEQWLASDNPKLPDQLGVARQEVFPFDWCYRLPVANDVFHAPKG